MAKWLGLSQEQTILEIKSSAFWSSKSLLFKVDDYMFLIATRLASIDANEPLLLELPLFLNEPTLPFSFFELFNPYSSAYIFYLFPDAVPD